MKTVDECIAALRVHFKCGTWLGPDGCGKIADRLEAAVRAEVGRLKAVATNELVAACRVMGDYADALSKIANGDEVCAHAGDCVHGADGVSCIDCENCPAVIARKALGREVNENG